MIEAVIRIDGKLVELIDLKRILTRAMGRAGRWSEWEPSGQEPTRAEGATDGSAAEGVGRALKN